MADLANLNVVYINPEIIREKLYNISDKYKSLSEDNELVLNDKDLAVDLAYLTEICGMLIQLYKFVDTDVNSNDVVIRLTD